MKQFIVVTPGGLATFASPDPREALAFAEQSGSVQWLAPTEAELAAARPRRMANPRGRPLESCGDEIPKEAHPLFDPRSHSGAMRQSSLPVVPESIMDSMSLQQAYCAIRPIFEEVNRASVAATVASGATAGSGTVRMDLNGWLNPGGWLGVNAKLSKTNGRGVALGLALLPEWSAFRLMSAAGVSVRGVSPPQPAAGLHVGRDGVPTSTFCVGSTPECRSGCLINSGQNASAIRADYVKLAKAKALLERPYEFMRILGEACAKYEKNNTITEGKKGIAKFLRLNVLSDIPWEEVAPWLFTRFPGLTPFDYTKVPGRPHLPNYDLSFSYSGGNKNVCLEEYRGGRNIVQVYVASEYVIKQNIARYSKEVAPARVLRALASTKGTQKRAGDSADKADAVALATWLRMNPLPKRAPLGGYDGPVVDVVDGDITDFRPMDPRGVIVGLRWKAAKVYNPETGRRGELPFNQLPKRFILYGDAVDTESGPMFVLGETPNSSGTEEGARLQAARRTLTEAEIEASRTARTGAIRDEAASQWKILGGGKKR